MKITGSLIGAKKTPLMDAAANMQSAVAVRTARTDVMFPRYCDLPTNEDTADLPEGDI